MFDVEFVKTNYNNGCHEITDSYVVSISTDSQVALIRCGFYGLHESIRTRCYIDEEFRDTDLIALNPAVTQRYVDMLNTLDKNLYGVNELIAAFSLGYEYIVVC